MSRVKSTGTASGFSTGAATPTIVARNTDAAAKMARVQTPTLVFNLWASLLAGEIGQQGDYCLLGE